MLDLNSLMVGTDDPATLGAFYRNVLGKPTMEDDVYTGWQVGSGWFMISAHSEVKGRNEMPGRVMWNFETPDVTAEFERIKGLGANVHQDPYTPEGAPKGMKVATFEDPDGNYFQLMSPMPQE
jgi:predicted enzyme related to lactoylglutathione lyase